RLSHQAPRVPGPLPELVPPRRNQPGGDDRPGGHAHAPELRERSAGMSSERTGRRPPPTVRRLLSFLRPQRAVLAAAIVATALFALLDASVYVLLIPFVETLFVRGGEEAAAGS